MKKLLLIVLITMSVLSSAVSAREVSIEERITGLYVAYFNRAGDQEGVNWWKGLGEEAEAEGNSASEVLKELSFNFSQHPSFARAYGDMDNQEFVEAVYRNTLGREGDAPGVAYWSGRLNLPLSDPNYLSRSDFVSIFVEAALTFNRDDPQYEGLSQEDLDAAQLRQDLITNKVEAALAFTHQLGNLSNVEDNQNPESDPAYLASIKIISEVTEKHETVEDVLAFLSSIANSVDPIDDIIEAAHISISDIIKEFDVSGENPIIEDGKIRIAFSSYSLETGEDKNFTMIQKPLSVMSVDQNLDEPVEMTEQVYDLTLEGQKEFIDPVEMTFPFDTRLLADTEEMAAGVISEYYNTETNETESVDYQVNEVNGTITIMTNHFSRYVIRTIKGTAKKGPFKVIKDHTRYAQIIDVDPYYPLIHSNEASEIIGEAFENDMEGGDKAYEAAFGEANNLLGFGASGNTIVGSAYSSTLLTNLTEAFNKVGAIAAIVQAGIDFQKGDTQALYTNLLKNGVYNTVNFIGSSALQLAFVGVFAIDYSINSFASEAWDGSNAKWHAVYQHCYHKHFDKSTREWYKLFYWTWHDAAYSDDPQDMSTIQTRISQIILDNVWGVWNNLSASSLSECVDDLGYTNLGGLNTDIKTSLALAKRAELVAALEPVFLRLQRPVNYKMREDYRKQLTLFKAYLNQFVQVQISETVVDGELSKYAGYKVRFAPLNEDTNASMWTGTLPMTASPAIQTRFTLLGHLQAGSPYRLEVFKPEDDPDTDAPVKTIEFTISLPQVVIELGEGVSGGVPTNLQSCPAKQDGAGGLIVDQTHHMLYANLEGDAWWDTKDAISRSTKNYFTCTYSDFQNELYYADYIEEGRFVRSEEWYNSSLPGRPAKIKYLYDFRNGFWERYDWSSIYNEETEETEWIYEKTGSGSL